VPLRHGRIQPPGEARERRREAHADRDRLAVPHREVLYPLDRVAERVPVVEELPLAGLTQVCRDHRGLHRDRALDQLALVRTAGAGGRRRVGLDQVEDDRVGDEPGLDDLGQPADVLRHRKARQYRGIGQYSGRRVERADEVLALRRVDRGLPADRRVGHAEQRRGHQYHPHPAQPCRGHKAGQVCHGAAADADDRVGAADTGSGQLRPQARRHADLLGRLAVGHRLGLHGIPGPGQGLAHRRGDAAEPGRVNHDHGAHLRADQRRQLRQHAGADSDLVRVLAANRDPPGGHWSARPAGPGRLPRSTVSAISAAISSGLRWLVLTVSQARPS
jgi:hypothetical protein